MWGVEDNRLSTFTRICDEIANERSLRNKTKILREFLRKGCNKKKFQGDTLLWVRMLIPGDSQRIYNFQNRKIVKLFSLLFKCDTQEMQLDLEQGGDISETLRKFFVASVNLKPQYNSVLYLQEVDDFIQKFKQLTTEDEQTELLRELCKKSTASDLRTIIRIIKQDLRMNAKDSHILAVFGPMAYSSYQETRNLPKVLEQFSFEKLQNGKTARSRKRKLKKNMKTTPKPLDKSKDVKKERKWLLYDDLW